MCLIDYDPPRCFRQSHRTARKEHRCCECHSVIRPGERYRYDSLIDCDGHPGSYKTCLACERIRDWLGAEMKAGRIEPNNYVDECGSWVYEFLGEACQEALSDWCDQHDRCRDHYRVPLDAALRCEVCG